MTSSKYLIITDFNKHVIPAPEFKSSIGISELMFDEGFNPNNYMLRYSTRNIHNNIESHQYRIDAKLNPYLPTKSIIKLMENISIGIGHELLIQFTPLEGISKPDSIRVKIEYQIYL